MVRKNSNFVGVIKQLTIFGELSFILGSVYLVNPTMDERMVTVAGTFGVVGVEERVDATIEMEKHHLVDHMVL